MSRVRLMMGAAALLYLGPLLAGLGGYGWPWVPAFAAVFVLWLIVMRPQDWPRRAAAWAMPDVPLRAVTQIAVQLLLVSVLFALGRGIGGVAGLAPFWPVWAPLLLSALSVLLARLMWNPAKAAEMEAFLDEALVRLHGAAPPLPSQDDRQRIDAVIRQLRDLPPGTDAQTVAALLAPATEELPLHGLTAALLAEAEGGGPPALLAFTLHATDGEVAEMSAGDLPTRAFSLVADQPALLALYAQRMLGALDSFPGLWGASPSDVLLGGVIAAHGGTAAEGPLVALRARLRELAPDED
jgi:hypothetical protein